MLWGPTWPLSCSKKMKLRTRILFAALALLSLPILAQNGESSRQKTRLQAKIDYFHHKLENPSAGPWLKLPLYDSLVSLYDLLGDKKSQYETQKEQITFLKRQGYFSQAIQVCQNILASLENHPHPDSTDTLHHAEIQLSLATMLSHAGMYQESVAIFLELLRTPVPDWILLQAHSYLGYIYMQQNQLNQSLIHHRQARSLFHAMSRDSMLIQEQKGVLFNHLASWYYSQGQYDSAICCLKEIIVKGSADEEYQKLLSYNNMGLIYMSLDEIPIAEEYLRQAVSLAKEQKNTYMEAVSLQNLAWLYLQAKDLQKSESVYLQAIDLSKKMNFKDLLSSLMIAYSDLLFQTGRYQDFKEYYTIGIEKRDSLNGLMSQIQIDYLTAKYETYKMASEKKILEQNLHMTNLSNQRRGIILAISALLIIILLAYILNMFKKLREKNRENNRLSNYIQSTKLLSKEGFDSLASSIESKNRELAARSLYLVRVNDMIKQLAKEVERIRRCDKTDEKNSLLDNLRESLSQFEGNVNGWQDFRFYFEQIHKDFYADLTSQAPDLSPLEQRLCALLASNLTVKEIAEITNRSPRTIETMIYRIRKKLGLSSDIKLPLYLQKFL